MNSLKNAFDDESVCIDCMRMYITASLWKHLGFHKAMLRGINAYYVGNTMEFPMKFDTIVSN